MEPNKILSKVLLTLLKNHQIVEMEYCKTKGIILYNLQTGFKSNIHLGIIDNCLIAYMRYNEERIIECVDDLLDIHSYWFRDATSRGWGKITCQTGWKELYTESKIHSVPFDERN